MLISLVRVSPPFYDVIFVEVLRIFSVQLSRFRDILLSYSLIITAVDFNHAGQQ